MVSWRQPGLVQKKHLVWHLSGFKMFTVYGPVRDSQGNVFYNGYLRFEPVVY